MYYVLNDHQGGIDKIDTGANPFSTYVNESFTPFGNRLCVLVDRAAGTFGVAGNKDDEYIIVKGY